ncbi:hypothetical protein ACFLRU_04145 [Bacteroidota bacterium]
MRLLQRYKIFVNCDANKGTPMSYFKKIFFLSVVLILVVGCVGEPNQQNNFVPDVYFSTNKSFNLPEASGLWIVGGYAVFPDLGYRGVLVYRISDNNFLAYDLAAPHLPPTQCSVPMDYETDWPNITSYCGEEDVSYSVTRPYANYQGETYEMQEYSAVQLDGQTIQIRNF